MHLMQEMDILSYQTLNLKLQMTKRAFIYIYYIVLRRLGGQHILDRIILSVNLVYRKERFNIT